MVWKQWLLGSWINSGAIHEAKKRRATQIITCSFPRGKWLHMVGAQASPRCELCRKLRRERRHGQKAIEHLQRKCRKKQWCIFKAQDVKRKRRASLGLFSVPSPSMWRRNVCDFEVIGQVEVICLSLFEVIQKRLSNKTVKKDFSNKDRQLSVFVKKDFQTKDRQLESLWKEAKIGGVLPWEGIAD